MPGGRSQVIGGSAALANRIHVSAPGAPYVNIKPAMRKHPETAWKQMLMLRIYSTSQSNSGVCARRPMRKQYTRHAETSRNSLATSAHVADLQHWPNKFTCPRLAPNAETLHPPCGNIQKQLGNKCSCCGFTALANQIHASALGAQFGNNLKQAWKQGPCHRFLALADENGPVPLSAPSPYYNTI